MSENVYQKVGEQPVKEQLHAAPNGKGEVHAAVSRENPKDFISQITASEPNITDIKQRNAASSDNYGPLKTTKQDSPDKHLT